LRVYANLPLAARQDIVVVLAEGPLSWQAAYFEVINKTPRADEILRQLDELKIL
jgi:hypothetical protein